MKEIFEIAAAIIASLGGGAILVFGLSSWLGKIWADRILEKQKSEHNKELECYKSELNKELGKINVRNEKALYVSKAQYDNEYKIYQEIWSAMQDCVTFSTLLYPAGEDVPIDEVEKEKFEKDKYSKFVNAYNNFSTTIDKFAPFYKEDFYNDFIEIRNLCGKLGSRFKTYEFDVKYNATFAMARDTKMNAKTFDEVYDQIPSSLNSIKSKLQKEIREYLLNLQVV